ncbi:hypothetical protein [Nocardia pseudovaccinii]|uniref:hypothetical protein n=1 Tax=Nocardia pseudovaccinii TaxID=189540 RepID=UPI0007A50B84|nr:hypothetical protein [Nocardia pseudovaccinii]
MAKMLDPRDWFRFHAGMPEHPKVDPLSDSAFRALVEAWCLCRRTGNDGRIPMSTWRKRWKAKPRAELVDAGLVHLDDDAAVMHDWLEHQPSTGELNRKRELRAEAGKRGGQKSGETRRERSKSATKTEANASTETGHKVVTAAKKPHASEELSTGSDFDAAASVSDSIKTRLPAQIAENGEANASVLLEQTPKQNTNGIEPEIEIEIDIGHLGGNRYVSNAVAPSDDPPPPTHHREHPNVFVPGCVECADTNRARIAWLNEQIAVNRPSDRCAKHAAVPHPPPCGQCADARRSAEQWDREKEKRLAGDAEARRALVQICTLCDENGWRKPPPELRDADPCVSKCNHLPGDLPPEWRALIAELLATPTQETTSA